MLGDFPLSAIRDPIDHGRAKYSENRDFAPLGNDLV
jgi:hypothetical protein